eukprot:3994861-Alexandrium_andersonii.AAC.1
MGGQLPHLVLLEQIAPQSGSTISCLFGPRWWWGHWLFGTKGPSMKEGCSSGGHAGLHAN